MRLSQENGNYLSIDIPNQEFDNWAARWLCPECRREIWQLQGAVGTGKTTALLRILKQNPERRIVYLDLKEFASHRSGDLLNYIYILVRTLREQKVSTFPEFQMADYVYCNKSSRVPLFMQDREKIMNRAEEVYGLVSDVVNLDMLGAIGAGVKAAKKAHQMYEVHQIQRRDPQNYKRLNQMQEQELREEVTRAAIRDIDSAKEDVIVLLDHYEKDSEELQTLLETAKKSRTITWIVSAKHELSWIDRERRFMLRPFTEAEMELFWEQCKKSGVRLSEERKEQIQQFCEGNPLLLEMAMNDAGWLEEESKEKMLSPGERVMFYMGRMMERLSLEEQSMLCQLAVMGQFDEAAFIRFFPGKNLYLYEQWLQNHFFYRQGERYFVQNAFSNFLNRHYQRPEILDYCRNAALQDQIRCLEREHGNAGELMRRIERLGEHECCRKQYEQYVLANVPRYEALDGLGYVKRIIERRPQEVFEQAPEIYFKEGNYRQAMEHLKRIRRQGMEDSQTDWELRMLPYCEIAFRILEVESPSAVIHERSLAQTLTVLAQNQAFLPKGMYVRLTCITLIYYAKFLTGRGRKEESQTLLERAEELMEDPELVRIYRLYRYKGMLYEKLGETWMDKEAGKALSCLEKAVSSYQYAIDSEDGWDSELLLSAGLAHKRLVETYAGMGNFTRSEHHYRQAAELYERVRVRNRNLMDYYVKSVYLNIDYAELMMGQQADGKAALLERNLNQARERAGEGLLMLELENSSAVEWKKQSRQLLNAFAKTNRYLAEWRRQSSETPDYTAVRSLYEEGIEKAEASKRITKDPPYAWKEAYELKYSMAAFLKEAGFPEEAKKRWEEARQDEEDYGKMMSSDA